MSRDKAQEAWFKFKREYDGDVIEFDDVFIAGYLAGGAENERLNVLLSEINFLANVMCEEGDNMPQEDGLWPPPPMLAIYNKSKPLAEEVKDV